MNPSVERIRSRLYHSSIQSTPALIASARLFQRQSAAKSVFSIKKKLSTTALPHGYP